ncbi:MAG: hypothetical protein L0Y44_13145 [Phycisphaerales bacterium]|nr:hypothetical protein [Phycisphaerales bacterium]MCI0631590.1 hypothetical protein [Phycisphaerales bacterium]MCI0674159.1 hypothetical protein [Phycisphaerales bacterium]
MPRKDPDRPINPLPDPNSCEVNQPSPANKALDPSWRPYETQLGQAEPEGRTEESGVRREAETQAERTGAQGKSLPVE